MKYDELTAYNGDVTIPVYGTIADAKVYLKKDVDEAIAEKDKEISELKKKLMPCLNGDCILTCEVVEKYGKENAELKAKLESVQASMYCNVVDANMEVRRLKRALYKACANWAMNARMVEIEAEPWGENHESRLWAGVYDKCLKKAEEYK